jgi:hypothetical protein
VQDRVSLVPMEVLPRILPEAMDMLAPAIDMSGGRWAVEDVAAAIAAGQSQLWLAFTSDDIPIAALVTRIEDYPQRRMLSVLFTGGEELKFWHQEMLDALEEFGAACGCEGLELTGRHGWKKFLAEYGWEAKYVVCEKTIAAPEENRDVA